MRPTLRETQSREPEWSSYGLLPSLNAVHTIHAIFVVCLLCLLFKLGLHNGQSRAKRLFGSNESKPGISCRKETFPGGEVAFAGSNEGHNVQIANSVREHVSAGYYHYRFPLIPCLPHLFLKTIWYSVGLRKYEITYENAGAVFQRRDQVAQDLNAFFIRPVVEDQAKEVCVSVFDGLRLEKIILHELYSPLVLFGQSFLRVVHLLSREILNDEPGNGRVLGDFEGCVAARSSYLGGEVSKTSVTV